MSIRTTRQAEQIRRGIRYGSQPGTYIPEVIWYAPKLVQRAYRRTRNKPPAGVNEQLRQDHPERHASNESKWKVGDEIVTIHSEAGTVVISKDLAERMGIQGKPGRIIE